jgi:bifunctional DNA-binding transcriptional regulator/antitoxin component of YhaV-PrlF toxin-antitoxin module
MKIGKLANTNSKGQFVIPQEYREMFGITPQVTLNISPKYNGLFIEPIKDVVSSVKVKDVYEDVLLSTRGSWGKASSSSDEKRQLELEASKRRKQGW